MTRDEYGRAYESGFDRTVRFLRTAGVPTDSAAESAQAAWVRGWERIGQLRDSGSVVAWISSIALNLFRKHLPQRVSLEALGEIPVPPQVNLARIDVDRILRACPMNHRSLLRTYYLEGAEIQEIARNYGQSETAVRVRLLRARRSAHRSMKPKPLVAPSC
jgi:RNA polymerase sigma factor (sigma-70 family)